MAAGWELVLISFAALALIAGTDGAGTDKTYTGTYTFHSQSPSWFFRGHIHALEWQLSIT